MAVTAASRRLRVRVSGTVQGVGFRPFVFRLAGELELAGFVRNDERGVEIEVQGEDAAVERFLERLADEVPPLARIEALSAEPLPTRDGVAAFAIAPSIHAAAVDTQVAPDSATCPECLAELIDPGDRRFRYPFINCTNCGPRFTIVRGVPYDRQATTMAGFEMCEACRAEYEDPLDRRFHAQPNACPACGPRVRLQGLDAGSEHDPVEAAARLIAGGAILAIKGLGGYHLACRADEAEPVERLRARKHREDRPFALMVASPRAAGALVRLEHEEQALLAHPARPIVLAQRRGDAPIAAAVAPRSRELGLMLPYTPLHHLLLGDAGRLGVTAMVMTSGNVSDEPIAYEDEDARLRLASIADGMLTHDRPIHMRTDDSVVRVVRAGSRRRTTTIRRSRGFVPASVSLPVGARTPILACGAELKSTFCLARGEPAWVGHHIGDLGNWQTLRSFREGIEHFERLFAVIPELLAHDLHPDYLSSTYAREREGVRLIGVQHHHAHLAAVLAEHGERGPAVGAIYDGAGYGGDGTVWGGELLVGDLRGSRRAGHLRPVPLPGGDRATREPWRMACVWLAETLGQPAPEIPPALRGEVPDARWSAVAAMARQGLASPPCTSIGRLCDAVAALCGLRAEVSYEGQAAIELEALADPRERGGYPIDFARGQLDARPAIGEALADLARGVPTATVSARFHNGVAAVTGQACIEIAEAAGVSLAVLGGGVFQNRLLLERTAAILEQAGLRVLIAERLPANDGGISFGQAASAAALLADQSG